MDLIQSFYGARFALLADDIISFRNRSNVLGLHFSNAENSPKKLPQNDLLAHPKIIHSIFSREIAMGALIDLMLGRNLGSRKKRGSIRVA